ncbi:MAG: type II toxin-antitoxin system VapC family toxin [Phycisphaerae bacterium]
MRIYFDVCCLNRAFDDQTQQRVRLETEAIDAILDLCLAGEHDWIASAAVEDELSRDPDQERREQSLALLKDAAEILTLTPAVAPRAAAIGSVGVGWFDALPLALAEASRCAVLLTTDDVFLQRVRRLIPPSVVSVENPLQWWMENIR